MISYLYVIKKKKTPYYWDLMALSSFDRSNRNYPVIVLPEDKHADFRLIPFQTSKNNELVITGL